jgi:hypothetical protein
MSAIQKVLHAQVELSILTGLGTDLAAGICILIIAIDHAVAGHTLVHMLM